jgi:hypothetical protein
MSKRRGNFDHNYPLVINYLKANDIEYIEYAGGQHLRIMGDVALVDLWPSRMTYHIIESEEAHRVNEYKRLSLNFDSKELTKILEGEPNEK